MYHVSRSILKGKSVHDVRRLAHNDIIHWSGNLGDAMCEAYWQVFRGVVTRYLLVTVKS